MVTRRSILLVRSPFRRASKWAVLWAFLVLGCASAYAQDYDAAGKHFAAGQTRFAGKQFHTAALEFQAAYDITKDGVLLYNIGEAWQKAGEGEKAVASYRAYLKERPAAQDRLEIEKRITLIEGKKLKVADESVASDKAEAQSYVSHAADVAPAPAVVTPAAEPEPAPVVAPAPAPPVAEPPRATAPPPLGLLDDRPSTRLRTAAWCSVAATIALVTTGAILGLAAQSRGDEIERRLNFVDAAGQPRAFDKNANTDFQNLKDEGHLYNGLAIGFYSGAAAMAVATTTLFLVDWKRGKERRQTVRLAPSLSPSSAGLVVGGSF